MEPMSEPKPTRPDTMHFLLKGLLDGPVKVPVMKGDLQFSTTVEELRSQGPPGPFGPGDNTYSEPGPSHTEVVLSEDLVRRIAEALQMSSLTFDTRGIGKQDITIRFGSVSAKEMKGMIAQTGKVFFLHSFNTYKNDDGTYYGKVTFRPGKGIMKVIDVEPQPKKKKSWPACWFTKGWSWTR